MRNNKSNFRKHFKFVKLSNATSICPTPILVNEKDKDNFVISRSNLYRNPNYFRNKENRMSLLEEITDMCDYDMDNATFDVEAIKDWIGKESLNNKKDIIYSHNFAFLGQITYNTFDLDGIRLASVNSKTSLPFSIKDMVWTAFQELLQAKEMSLKMKRGLLDPNTPVVAFGATLILSTVIENQLKLDTKIHYSKQFITALDNQIKLGNATLTQQEQHLLNYNKKQLGLIKHYTDSTKFTSHAATYQLFYDLLTGHNIIKSNDKNLKGIFEVSPFTLNELIQSKYFKNIVDKRFWTALYYLYGRKKFNLRNQLSHCEVRYLNYYNINITMVLYYLFYTIADKHYFKD